MVTPVNPQYKAAEVAYQLSNAETKALVVARDLYPIVAGVRDQVPTLATVVSTAYGDYLPERPTLAVPKELLGEPSAPPAATDDLSAILEHTAPLDRFEPVDLWNDVGLMTFTSGTTGRPKGAMLSYGSSLFKMAVSFNANRMTEDTVSLGIAPLCHIAGMNFGVYQPVYARQTLVILARFEPATTIDAIEHYRVSNWYAIAPMLRAILDFPGVRDRDLTSLSNNPCTSFGIPSPRNWPRNGRRSPAARPTRPPTG